MGLSPRRALRGHPIGLGSDTGRPWPEPQLETLNSRWWAVCTERVEGRGASPGGEVTTAAQFQGGLACFLLGAGAAGTAAPDLRALP